MFRNVLVDRGITVGGEARVGCLEVDEIIDIATHDSPPLGEIVAITNKETKNLWADQLLIILGLEIAEDVSWDDGITVVRACIEDLGLPSIGLKMVDGSGLSRLNLASADFMTALLLSGKGRSWYGDFIASLPVAGRDGTLRERMKGSSAEGRIRAKTGSMSAVRTLSGFAETVTGRQLVFSIMVNGYPAPGGTVDRAIDRVCALLTHYGSD
jgi:PBP4 family serine-type D-alanyl-D-alanine carboxypeptidase